MLLREAMSDPMLENYQVLKETNFTYIELVYFWGVYRILINNSFMKVLILFHLFYFKVMDSLSIIDFGMAIWNRINPLIYGPESESAILIADSDRSF